MGDCKNFTLKDFTDLDKSHNVDFLIASMEAHSCLESMKAIKQRALDLLDLQKGDAVIELGCGLGIDAELLADRVGKTGSVVAIDASERMITEAKKRSKHENVAYYQGDAAKIDFPDNHFMAYRADRLLVSQKKIMPILFEALRVIRKGGRICITALDFSGMKLEPVASEITGKVIAYWQQLVENPFIGKELLNYLRKLNLVATKIQPETFSVDSYQTLKTIVPFESMLSDMVAIKIITLNEQKIIIDLLKETDMRGDFLWKIDLVTVVGCKSV